MPDLVRDVLIALAVLAFMGLCSALLSACTIERIVLFEVITAPTPTALVPRIGPS